MHIRHSNTVGVQTIMLKHPIKQKKISVLQLLHVTTERVQMDYIFFFHYHFIRFIHLWKWVCGTLRRCCVESSIFVGTIHERLCNFGNFRMDCVADHKYISLHIAFQLASTTVLQPGLRTKRNTQTNHLANLDVTFEKPNGG